MDELKPNGEPYASSPKHRISQKKYYAKDPNACVGKSLAWREANRERYNALMREVMRKNKAKKILKAIAKEDKRKER